MRSKYPENHSALLLLEAAHASVAENNKDRQMDNL